MKYTFMTHSAPPLFSLQLSHIAGGSIEARWVANVLKFRAGEGGTGFCIEKFVGTYDKRAVNCSLKPLRNTTYLIL